MSTLLEQNQYGFDRNSRRTWQKRPLTYTQDQQYNYDALSQVSAAARGSLNLNASAISGIPANSESWEYDPTGNWRGYHNAVAGATPLVQYGVHDRGNRLTQIEVNPNNMILDRAGRVLQMAPDASGDWDGKLEITWDAWSRIISVKNNGTEVGSYGYDGTHRRTTRAVDEETLHSYYNDTWRPVEERKDAETTASISYLWGARHRDDLVRRDRAVGGSTLNETRYVLMDYFNPVAITDEAGEVKERYAFSAFGLRTILNPDFTVSSSSECGMEFGFQGQFIDSESGLMNYGYRYYSPQLGRWACKDPIGERGGPNIYTFVKNGSPNSVDLLGLAEVTPKKEKCKIVLLVGHSSSVTGANVMEKLKDPVNGDLMAADRIACVTCNRETTNDSIPEGKYVPAHENPRTDNYIFPSSKEEMKRHKDYNKERGDETVGSAFKKELSNAKAEAEKMCNCCKTTSIFARKLDKGGGDWLSANVFSRFAGNGPLQTYNCETKKWKVINPDSVK